MDPRRHSRLVLIGVTAAFAAACFFVAYLLPEGGVLGLVASGFTLIGMVATASLPMNIWRFISPDGAARWEKAGGRPVPLIAPIIFWTGTIVVAWILLTGTDPAVTFGDYAALVFLWCVVAGAAAFSIAFTRMYLKDRRRTAQ